MIAGINKICDEPGPTLDCKVAPLNHCSYSYFFISKQFNFVPAKGQSAILYRRWLASHWPCIE